MVAAAETLAYTRPTIPCMRETSDRGRLRGITATRTSFGCVHESMWAAWSPHQHSSCADMAHCLSLPLRKRFVLPIVFARVDERCSRRAWAEVSLISIGDQSSRSRAQREQGTVRPKESMPESSSV